MAVSDQDARNFYEKECLNSRWSIRELRRQIDSALFQRLLLSDGTLNKQKVLELSQKGQVIEKPGDIKKIHTHFRIETLRNDYENMSEMLFGEYLPFDELLKAIDNLEKEINET